MFRAFVLLLALLPGLARAETVTLPGPAGIPLRAVLERPVHATRPPVIALHGCLGLGPAGRPPRLSPREQGWAARLVALGHPVLFPDSFGSRELGPACGRPDHPMPPRLREADALAAVAWAAAQPWAAGAPVLLGWSHGGTTVLRAWARAPAGALSAAIAFYPGCGGFSPGSAWAANATAPLLMQLGAADDWTPPGPCLRLAAGAGPRVTATAYPGAHHGFDAPGETLRAFTLPDGRSVTAGGQPAAREAAQAAVAAFLARHAAGP